MLESSSVININKDKMRQEINKQVTKKVILYKNDVPFKLINLFDELFEHLPFNTSYHIFQDCLRKGVFPEKAKLTEVILVCLKKSFK